MKNILNTKYTFQINKFKLLIENDIVVIEAI